MSKVPWKGKGKGSRKVWHVQRKADRACVSRKKILVQLALGIKVFRGVWRMRVEVSPLFMLRSFILPS